LLHGIVVVLLLFPLLIALVPFVPLLALVQILVHVGVHHPDLHKAPASLMTEFAQGRGLFLLPVGGLLDNTAKFTKEISLRDLGQAVALLVESKIASVAVYDFIHLRLEFLLMANDAAIFALGTVSHRARRFAPCSWRLSVQLVVSLFIPTLQRLLALLSNVCKIVFLFYAVPFCLDAVWRIFHDKDENREE
jgi:hypothetical protein